MEIAYSRPRFRTDLLAKTVDEAGQRFVDVTDPDSGKTFRFYEVEYSIACAMDGRRDLAKLVEWAQAELGVEPGPDELRTVISTLDELGYLEQAATSSRSGFALGTAGAMEDEDEEEALASGDEFELGNAGKSPFDRSEEERLEAPELTLGFSGNEAVETGPGELPSAGDEDEPVTMISSKKSIPGMRELTAELGEPPPGPFEPTSVQPVLRPVSRARTNDEEGPTNIPPPVTEFDEEVSVDLTDHMRIGAADVKEAVRQSKVIQAVEMPPELAQRMRGRSATDEDDAAATTEREAPRLEPPPGATPRMQTPPAVSSGAAAATTELPDVPAFVSKPLATPLEEGAVGSAFRAERSDSFQAPAEKKSSVGILLVVLLIVALAAGAAYYFLIYAPAQQTVPVEQPPATVTPTAPEPPPTPERPSARLAAAAVEPAPVTASAAGEIKEILASGTEVAENDVVVKLAGYEAFQKKIDDAMSDVDRYQKRIAATEEKKKKAEEGNPSAGERYQKDIERDQQKIAAKEQAAEEARKAMEPYVLRAPIAGKIVTERAAGQTVAAGDAVFSVELPPELRATFTVEGEAPGKDAEVKVAVKGDESKTGTCSVLESKGQEITVSCPSSEPFADGTEIVLLQ
jgi:biotin carboxyl carrier protein